MGAGIAAKIQKLPDDCLLPLADVVKLAALAKKLAAVDPPPS
jgi:hypothetical protein